MKLSRLLLAVVVLCGAAGAAEARPVRPYEAAIPYSSALAARLAGSEPVVVGDRVLDGAALRALYGARGYAPLWIGEAGILPTGEALQAGLSGLAAAEGLEPVDYYPEEIGARLRSADEEARVGLELLLSAAAMRYGADVQAGRFNPRVLGDEIDYDRKPVDRPAIALATAHAPDPIGHLRSLAPTHARYADLRTALARYRALAAAGGWPQVPGGDTLRPGDISDRLIALRDRLAVTGDYRGEPAAMPGPFYEGELVEAVRRFQARHGLGVDGVVGRRTLAAFNVPVEERVDQILASMERWRWLPADLGRRYIMVNLPDYRLILVEDGDLVRDMSVIVGQDDRRTPLFSSALTWLEFNPTWTMPRSIAVKDYLPKLLNDPSYLANHGIRLFSGWHEGAMEMDARFVDWAQIGTGIRHYMLRQEPGPGNALGKVKFMMANNFSVYLHDTPSRGLFSRSHRALSSGCVRVEDPVWLADHLLADSARWQGSRDRVLSGWDTTRIDLPRPMPLHLTYTTALVDPGGEVGFREDIYGLDAAVVAAIAEARPRSVRVASAN
ncbi:MAG TPA: L,D-transpeptidase family protein [Alphaproteobacteria bacterium]|nr:L,D-transpeptidase family protein [Alphaproteobacteria bacterium]